MHKRSYILVLVFLVFTLIGGCNTEDGTFTVRQIGELTSVLADGIAARVNLIPFEAGSDTPIILEGETIFTLNNEEKEALIETYNAGFSIVLLDAEEPEVDELLEIIDDGISYRSGSHDMLFAYIARNEGHYTARLVAEPVPGPNHDSTLKTTEKIIVRELGMPPDLIVPPPPSDGTANLQSFPVAKQIFSIPQPNNGAFNTTISLYAAHECLTNDDHYVVNAVADWTPGSFFQKASTPEQVGLNQWADGENDVCPGMSSGGSDNTSCRYVGYPKFYRVEMMPLSSGMIIQSEAAPEATQGTSTTYQSGIVFNIGGKVNVSKGPTVTGGVTWSNTKAVTIPALNTQAGNLANAGAFWEFQYCTTSNTSVTGCVNTLQTANPSNICQDQLGSPQQGQTVNGKFSDAAQTVHWEADPDTRQGASTFDIKVTFQAALANTEMRVYKSGGSQPGVFGTCDSCSAFAGCCDCQAATTNRDNDATKDATFMINFPSIKCDGDET